MQLLSAVDRVGPVSEFVLSARERVAAGRHFASQNPSGVALAVEDGLLTQKVGPPVGEGHRDCARSRLVRKCGQT